MSIYFLIVHQTLHLYYEQFCVCGLCFVIKMVLKEGSQLWGKLGNRNLIGKTIAFLNMSYFVFLGKSYDHNEKNISQRGRSYLYNAIYVLLSGWQMTGRYNFHFYSQVISWSFSEGSLVWILDFEVSFICQLEKLTSDLLSDLTFWFDSVLWEFKFAFGLFYFFSFFYFF